MKANLSKYMNEVSKIPGVIIVDRTTYYMPYPKSNFDNDNSLGASLKVFVSTVTPVDKNLEYTNDVSQVSYIKREIGNVETCDHIVDTTCSVGGFFVKSIGTAANPEIEIDDGHHIFRFKTDISNAVSQLIMLNCNSIKIKRVNNKSICFIDDRHTHELKNLNK